MSEKITCPFCEHQLQRSSKYQRDDPHLQIPCPKCSRYFCYHHARLAVQHARLVEAVKDARRFIANSPVPRSRRLRKLRWDAIGEIDKALEEQ